MKKKGDIYIKKMMCDFKEKKTISFLLSVLSFFSSLF